MKEIIDRQIRFQELYAKTTTFETMYKAVIEELGEYIASTGYHDWKVTQRDEHNLRIELVDICIFAINCLYYRPGLRKGKAKPALPIKDDFIFLTTIINLVNSLDFESLIAVIFSYYPEVKTLITGKQALNVFRQELGYARGAYNKLWSGKEDNVYLALAMSSYSTYEEIYAELERLYNVHN